MWRPARSSSFITFVKDQKDAELSDVPAVLKAAAVAMRHTEATQGSAAYDKKKHDRAIAAATAFCDNYARRFAHAPIFDGINKASRRGVRVVP